MSASPLSSQFLRSRPGTHPLVDPGTGISKEVEEWLEHTMYIHSKKQGFPSQKQGFPSRDQGITPCEGSSGQVTWAVILTTSRLGFLFRELGKDILIFQEQLPPTKCSVYVLSPWMSLRVGNSWGGVKKRENWAGQKTRTGGAGSACEIM